MKFAKEAWPFVIPFWVLSFIFSFLKKRGIAFLSLLTGGAVLLFFRDPERNFRGEEDVLTAPADGLITLVDTVEDPEIGPGTWQRIVTFLSVLDVHIQRCPSDGEVITSVLTPGQKVAAFRTDAGEVNENHLTVFETAEGDRIAVRQIAGLLARRVVSHLQLGDRKKRGDVMGLIKFGSRVDLYLPPGYELLVRMGDRVQNGLTPMARRPPKTPSKSS